MAMGFRAPHCAAACQWEVAAVRVAECGFGHSEAALRRVGGYRCRRRGRYCTRRIDAGRGSIPAGGWSRSCVGRWGKPLARLGSRGRLALESAWPHLDTAMTDRATKTHADLEVRRIYEPSRLAARYMSAAYAQVVPGRKRPVRSTASSALASVSGLVAVGPELGDVEALRAG